MLEHRCRRWQLIFDFSVCRYVWESQASGDYAISVDTDGEPLGRGTQINIHLKVGLEMCGLGPATCLGAEDTPSILRHASSVELNS